MVRRVFGFFAYLSFFLMMVIYFAPKVNIYYYMEKELKKHGVVISSESVEDVGMSLVVKDADLSMKSISSAVVDKIIVNVFVVYNRISLRDIVLSSTFKSFVPLKINGVDVVYSIADPLNVKIDASGDFGTLFGRFNIQKQSVHLILKPSKKMLRNNASTLRNLKKSDNGEFVYDKAF